MSNTRNAVFDAHPAIGVQQQERRANRLGRLGVMHRCVLGNCLLLGVQRFQLGIQRIRFGVIGIVVIVQIGKLRLQLRLCLKTAV